MMQSPINFPQDKFRQLEKWFSEHHASMVAFSGGIDSSMVLFLARQVQGKENVLAVISASESLKHRDLQEAREFCSRYDIRLQEIKTRELSDVHYAANPENRCFYCKSHLFKMMKELQTDYPEYELLSGTNRDDVGDYRPGINAAQNYRVLAPLADCGITKNELRAMARHFNLPNWNKPASPCLSSRIPYHQSVTPAKLQQIEEAESYLNQLGFQDVRVRHYGTTARIEVLPEKIAQLNLLASTIASRLSHLGFSCIDIDQEGLVSGKLNRSIGKQITMTNSQQSETSTE